MGRFLLILFLGWTGIHKFMDGKKGMGILYFFTIGIGGLGWIIDIIIAALAWRKQNSIHTTQYSNRMEQTSLYAETQQYIEYQNIIGPYSNKYFKGLEEIESMWSVIYNLKITSGEKADLFEEKCKQNLNDFYAWNTLSEKYDAYHSSPSKIPAFVRLAMLYEKQGRYEEAINICVEAIKVGAVIDGNKGKMYGRLARLIRKSGLDVNDEILKLSMKTE